MKSMAQNICSRRMKWAKTYKNGGINMEYVTLNNGVKMLKLGYGVYQVNPTECEICVLDQG